MAEVIGYHNPRSALHLNVSSRFTDQVHRTFGFWVERNLVPFDSIMSVPKCTQRTLNSFNY